MTIAKPKFAYSIAEAAEATGVSDRTIRRAIEAGDLAVRYPTSRAVIPVDELRAWIESKPSQRPGHRRTA